jgi:hypothetical protein
VAWVPREFSSAALTYAAYDSTTGVWTKTLSGLPDDAVGVPSLAFAADGTPSIAFQEGSETASHLAAATLAGATWTLADVDSTVAVTGVSPSAAFAGSKLRVAYYDQTNGNLRWAALGSTWSLRTLESANNVGYLPSLGYSSTGSSYISYRDKTKKDIRWARPG